MRNDLDPAQLGYTPPAVVHAALRASGFTRVASFGQPVPAGPVGQGTALQVEAIEPQYPPVEIFQAADPAARPAGPAAVLPAASTTLVDGGPAALLQLTGQGLLRTGQPAVIAGQDTAADPPAVRQDVTDGLRRADTAFGLPNNNTSYTYTATGTIPPDDPQGAGGEPPRQLLPAGTAGHQTVAVLTGAASVTASSAGSWLWEVPQADPVGRLRRQPRHGLDRGQPGQRRRAVDPDQFRPPALPVRAGHDPAARRHPAAGGHPPGRHHRRRARRHRHPRNGGRPAAADPVRHQRLAPHHHRRRPRRQPGRARRRHHRRHHPRGARHQLPAARPGSGGPDPSFSFHRATGTTLGLPGDPPEADLNRTFTTPAAERFQVSASVTAVPGAALNALLDRLGSAAPAQLRISATSTFASLPALRPQNLLDGAGWIAAGPSATVHL